MAAVCSIHSKQRLVWVHIRAVFLLLSARKIDFELIILVKGMSSVAPRRELLLQLLRMGVKELCQEVLLKKKKKKRIWVRDWISRRNELGASSRLLRELAGEDPASYISFNIFGR